MTRARVDQDDVGGLAARRLGDALRRHARDHADPLPVEEEPDELEVALVAAREDDGAAALALEVRDGHRCGLVGGPRGPGDPVAEREPAPLALAGAELDDLARAAARGGLERRQARARS